MNTFPIAPGQYQTVTTEAGAAYLSSPAFPLAKKILVNYAKSEGANYRVWLNVVSPVSQAEYTAAKLGINLVVSAKPDIPGAHANAGGSMSKWLWGGGALAALYFFNRK